MQVVDPAMQVGQFLVNKNSFGQSRDTYLGMKRNSDFILPLTPREAQTMTTQPILIPFLSVWCQLPLGWKEKS